MSKTLVPPTDGQPSVGTRITCVIVSWNVREHVVKCLESVVASAQEVGNRSRDGGGG